MVHACELASPSLCVENPGRVPSVINEIKEMHARFHQNQLGWMSKLRDEQLKTILEGSVAEPANEFFRVCEDELYPAALSGNVNEAQQVVSKKLHELNHKQEDALANLVSTAENSPKKIESEVSDSIEHTSQLTTVFGVSVLIICGLFGWYTGRDISQSLQNSAESLRHVAREELMAVGQQMRTHAQETTHQATLASGAASQVSANAQALTKAVEEFNTSIREMAGFLMSLVGETRQATSRQAVVL